MDKLILDDLYFYADGKDKDLSSWYQIAGFISMIIYLVLSLRKYFDYRIISQQTLSYADEVDYKWLKRFIQAFALILLLRFIFFFTNPEWWNFGSKYWYYLCFSILLMYISLTGYARSLKVYIPSKFDILSRPQDKDKDSNINSVSGIEDNLVVPIYF